MKPKRKKPLKAYMVIVTVSFFNCTGRRVRHGQENFLAVNAVPVPFTEQHAVNMARNAYRQIRRENEVTQ